MALPSQAAIQQGRAITPPSVRRDLDPPSSERLRELTQRCELNDANCRPVYYGVRFCTPGEVVWALQRQGWSGGHQSQPSPNPLGAYIGPVNPFPADLRGAEFKLIDLSSFSFPAADLRDARFIDCAFLPSQPGNVGTRFIDADLRGARFTARHTGQSNALVTPYGAVFVSDQRASQLHQQLASVPFEGIAIATRCDLLWLEQQPTPRPHIDLRHASVFEADLMGWNLEHYAATLIDATRAQRLDAFAEGNFAQGRAPFAMPLKPLEPLEPSAPRLETLQDLLWVKYQSRWAILTDKGDRILDARHADLSEGVFIGVNLCDARLEYASFFTANCSYGRFQQALCEEANFAEATLTDADFTDAVARGAVFAGCTATRANFRSATLAKADMVEADMSGANLSAADLRGADCLDATFHCVDLRGAHVDASTSFIRIHVNDKTEFGDIAWHGVPILDIDWTAAPRIGDEAALISSRGEPCTPGSPRERAYREVIRAYRQLWTILRPQGYEHAARSYRLREKALERLRLLEMGKMGQLIQSLVAYLLTGYGERPQNLLITYLVVVALCAGTYFDLAQVVGYHMTIMQSVGLSFSTFKGISPSPFPAALLQPHIIGTGIRLLGDAETFIGWLVAIGTTIIWERRLGGGMA